MTSPGASGVRGLRVVVRGGGDLASGIARRLHLAGARVAVLELPDPRVVRRAVAFASAVHEGEIEIEGVRGRLAEEPPSSGGEHVAVIVDPSGDTVSSWRPDVVVDARMRKRAPEDLSPGDAPLVIGVGPGPVAGEQCHAVVETLRGPDLGRVLREGGAAPHTGVPEPVLGHAETRVLRSPADGVIASKRAIGDPVEAGEAVAEVGGHEVRPQTSGVLRGLIRPGAAVRTGEKIGDVDPRGDRSLCFRVSDKANAVAGGVLEALLEWLAGR